MGEKEDRKLKLKQIREMGINPYPTSYFPTHYSQAVKDQFTKQNNTQFNVKIAGRIVLKRDFGKSIFMTLEDEQGKIQIYAQSDKLKENDYSFLTSMIDTGDILGVEGDVFQTQKGEITVLIQQFTLLSKAINPLPDKYHGLQNIELRYRQRYVDMISNVKIRNDFILRSKVCQYIREILYAKDYHEIETPVLHPIYGGANARPFETHHNALNMKLYLRIAVELYLKRVITGGIPRVFEMGRVFRNEGVSTKHNPEFTMLELYESYGNIDTMMSITEEIISSVVFKIFNSYVIEYQGKTLDFSTPWKRLPMMDAIEQYTTIRFAEVKDLSDLQQKAHEEGIDREIILKQDYWNLVFTIFDEKVESQLHGPVFIIDYPFAISPLAKQKPGYPELTERFELFIGGREYANAFSEQNDPEVQHEQFMQQVKQKDQGDDEAMMYDADYINCLEYGMPPTGGVGIGIDRLVMLLLDTDSIRDTILFPHMKPE